METTGLDTFRYTNSYPEQIPEEGTYKVYNNPDNLDIKTLLKTPSRPVFVFPKYLWDEVQYLTKQSPSSEFAMFLITKQFTQRAPKYMALDLYFPKQEAGHSGVSIDHNDCSEFYELLYTHEDYREHMHCRIAHLHSHNTMGVFWSGADTNQQLSGDDLGFYDDFRYYLVVNTHDQVRCSFVVYKPLLRRIDNIPVVVIGTEKDTLTDERKAELDAYLKERLTPLVTNVFADIRTFDGYETELPPPPAPKFTPLPLVTPKHEEYRPSEFSETPTIELDDLNDAALHVLRCAVDNYDGEFKFEEGETVAGFFYELSSADFTGCLAEMVESRDEILALASLFDGDMNEAVLAYEWLANNKEHLDVYRTLLNYEEV